VTTEAVARRAHISKKTLYQLFPNKEALLEAALMALIDRFSAHLDTVLSSDMPPLQRVDRFFVVLVGIISQVQRQILDQAREFSPRLWRQVEVERRKRLEVVGALVRHAQEEGLVRPDLDVGLWLVLLRTAVEGLVNPETVLRENLSVERILETLRRVLFEGILTEQGRSVLARYRKRKGAV
jgi:AcrR family transcriptional regulator